MLTRKPLRPIRPSESDIPYLLETKFFPSHGTIRTVIEIVRKGASAAPAKVAIFDFDGTLSVIRSGWMDIMVPLCVNHLAATNSGESREQLTQVVEEFVWKLTGKETIYQMMALSEEIRKRGGCPKEPIAYKQEYLAMLHEKIRHRLEELRDGGNPERYAVPGARAMVEHLSERGLTLYLASGTDHANVQDEVALLGLASFFGGNIFGAQDDLQSFSKALLVRRLVSESGLKGEDLVVFGDGFVEIEEVRKVGGTTVGVATAEPLCQQVDEWKRKRLIEAGADFVVPHFQPLPEIVAAIF